MQELKNGELLSKDNSFKNSIKLYTLSMYIE